MISYSTKMSIEPHLFPTGTFFAISRLQEKINTIKSLPLVIAIDGTSSSGKSSLATDFARLFDYKHLDSGAMYRAVTLYLIEEGIDIDDKKALHVALSQIKIDMKSVDGEMRIFLNNRPVDREIRSMEVSSLVSKVSSISAVRRFLVKQQRELGDSKKVIMDGRDIGTVVFPNAEIKIFLVASLEERARRRFEELVERNIETTLEEVTKNLEHRDQVDSNRQDSPLSKAPDAIELDTTEMDRNDQLYAALQVVIEKLGIK